MKKMIYLLSLLVSFNSFAQGPIVNCQELGIRIYTSHITVRGKCYDTGDVWQDCDDFYREYSFQWSPEKIKFIRGI